MKILNRCLVAIAFSVVMPLSAAQADLLIGNLPTDFSNVGLGTIITGAEGRSKAMGFTTPTGSAYVLDSATFIMQFTGDAAEPGAIPQVSIWDDAGGNPGTQLDVLTNPGSLGALGLYTFTASSGILLSPDTTYWILVNGAPTNTDPAADAFYWNAATPSITPNGLASFVGYRFSATSTPPTGNSTVFNNVQINASLAIPEPGSMVLLGMAAGVICLRRRRVR